MVPYWVTNSLEKAGIPYRTVHYSAPCSKRTLASAEHVRPDHVADVLMIHADERLVELVFPADCRVDFGELRELLHCRWIRVATNEEVHRALPDCEPDAIPPLRHSGVADVLMDHRMDVDGDIVFEAGSARDAVRMPFDDWLRLVNPRCVSLCAG